MTMRELVLDTSAVIELLKGNAAIRQHVTASECVYIPTIAVGELLGGALRSARPAENVAEIEEFVADYEVLDCDLNTARQYGDLNYRLRARGKPIPENDMWIASVALQHGLPLAAFDRHFDHVDSLVRVPC
jgi:tRNA(fMet)-specific endonuclease VapC